MNLFFKPKDYKIEIDLPASKSIHNRVMILNALYDLNIKITNPSNSGDSVLLQKLLKSKSDVLDCENAGTVFRFLTAYFSVKNEAVTLTGSQRMQSRPIAELVNSLKELFRGYSNITLYDSPSTIDIDGLKISLIPWINDANKIEYCDYIQNCSSSILMGPFELIGFEVIIGV